MASLRRRSTFEANVSSSDLESSSCRIPSPRVPENVDLLGSHGKKKSGGVPKINPIIQQVSFEIQQITYWVDYAPIFSVGAEYEGACKYVDSFLLHCTFLVGQQSSAADHSVWSGIAGAGKRWESIMKSMKYPNLVRWHNLISKELANLNKQPTKKIELGKPKTGHEEESYGSGKVLSRSEVDLPGAELGKVVLRFAPEPSGYLHIGHAKAAIMNQYFAQRYNGKLILRFDDTNPSKECTDFVDNILKDIETLGINYKEVTYTSDYFPQLMEMAEKLIREGKAYVDDTPRDQMKKERMDGTHSKCRNNSIDENMMLWKEMIRGSERGQLCCLRGKWNMQDTNKSLRDPVYYRHNEKAHHRIGSKYKIYPTYDFACPIVDSIEGITHALRSSEYHDRNSQYHRVQEDMGLRKVHIYEFSRLNMVYTLLSKRKLSLFVANKKVDGWDDARFPTVQGMLRRGLQIEALRQFILEHGASKNLNLMEWDKLWNINKKIIDPVCPRHTAVVEEGRVLLTLLNGPENPFVREMPKHKKYKGAGEKATTFTNKVWIEQADAKTISANEEVTLMDWGNAIVKEINKGPDGTVIQLTGVVHLEGSVKTTKLKLTWLPEINELVPLTLVEFDYLIFKKKVDEHDDINDISNTNTKEETAALGDSNMRNLKRGDIVQLERKGYFRCEFPFLNPSKHIILYAIPDGRRIAK